jgi:hypothetical protein
MVYFHGLPFIGRKDLEVFFKFKIAFDCSSFAAPQVMYWYLLVRIFNATVSVEAASEINTNSLTKNSAKVFTPLLCDE